MVKLHLHHFPQVELASELAESLAYGLVHASQEVTQQCLQKLLEEVPQQLRSVSDSAAAPQVRHRLMQQSSFTLQHLATIFNLVRRLSVTTSLRGLHKQSNSL